jgi:hypothetical protein
MKEPMEVISVRLPRKIVRFLKARKCYSDDVRHAIEFIYPDIENPPVIEISQDFIGFNAVGEDYDGATDSNCIVGWGKTEEEAKEDYLERWREKQ